MIPEHKGKGAMIPAVQFRIHSQTCPAIFDPEQLIIQPLFWSAFKSQYVTIKLEQFGHFVFTCISLEASHFYLWLKVPVYEHPQMWSARNMILNSKKPQLAKKNPHVVDL